jgi:hypothetical protein
MQSPPHTPETGSRSDGPAPDPAAATPSRQSGRRLLQSTSVVSGMTLISRVLGLARDIVLARYFGAGIVMDAFIVANRIPNMLRRFFAEGAFSQGFVPVMARYREQHDHQEARELVDAVAGTLGLVLFVTTLIGVVAAPLLVLIVAPGFVGEDGRFDLATAMVRFTFPYLFFVSLTAFAGGILNTYGRFAASAFTPVLLNVALIAAAMGLSPYLAEPGMALAYGVFIAGVVQLAFPVPFLAKINAIPRPRWRPKHEGVRRIGRLMLPAIFGSSVAQVNVLLGGVIASLLGVGKISLLYYSDATRLLSGLVETVFKDHIADKTNWRAMLKGDGETCDLEAVRRQLMSDCAGELDTLLQDHGLTAITELPDEPETRIRYPVLEYPAKVASHNLDKSPTVEGTLQGIKGQYLLFDTGVINMRKYGGYQLSLYAEG